MSSTRFPKGLTNVDGDNVLGNMKSPDPSKTFTFWDDFVRVRDNDWNVTNGTNTTGAPTYLLEVGNDGYGTCVFGQSAGTSADDEYQMAWSGQTSATAAKQLVSLENTKRTFFKMRFKIDVAGHGVNFGLFPGGTAEVWQVNNDEVSFLSPPGSLDLKVRVRQNGGSVVNDVVVGSLVNNQNIECAFEWHNGKLRVFVDGSHVTTLDVPEDPTQRYGFANAVKASTATDYEQRIDYVLVAQDR
jgi:hypothetical protein